MRWSRYGNDGLRLNGETLAEANCFKYLGSLVGADGGCDRDVVYRINEGYRAWGTLKSGLNNGGLGINEMKCLYEGVIAQTTLYGADSWDLRNFDGIKVNVLEMKCLTSLVGVSRMHRFKNEVRWRYCIEIELASRADQRVLRWLGT